MARRGVWRRLSRLGLVVAALAVAALTFPEAGYPPNAAAERVAEASKYSAADLGLASRINREVRQDMRSSRYSEEDIRREIAARWAREKARQ